jgi:hypothetical protein
MQNLRHFTLFNLNIKKENIQVVARIEGTKILLFNSNKVIPFFPEHTIETDC